MIGSSIALPKEKWNSKILAGLGLATKGDMEIILAIVALETAIISSNVFSMIIVMSITTMLVAPLLFYYVAKRNKVR